MSSNSLSEETEKNHRDWHPNHIAYIEKIVDNENYLGLPPPRRNKKNNRVVWMVANGSDEGQIRRAWWEQQCREHKLSVQKGNFAVVARIIHPDGQHVCQCCGKSLSIFYDYPSKPTIKKLQAKLEKFAQIGPVAPADYSIFEIIDSFCRNQVEINFVASILNLDPGASKEELKQQIKKKYAYGGTKKLSPGVMSDAPDRFDGFHSDGLCCRERTDIGRHPDNMKTYSQDRRAYEEWSEGDYKYANRVMGEFKKLKKSYRCPMCGKRRKMEPDHIGPISLGFCHNGLFTPLCGPCNSAKNNRFTKADVDKLKAFEESGIQVISWHSKPIWDLLKHRINDDESARLASSLMGEHHQNVLFAFAVIHKYKGTAFLKEKYLHPEYSQKEYVFEEFDPFHLDKLNYTPSIVNNTYTTSNQERYVRIAFESLEAFLKKENRRHEIHFDENNKILQEIISFANAGQYQDADNLLKETFTKLANYIVKHRWPE